MNIKEINNQELLQELLTRLNSQIINRRELLWLADIYWCLECEKKDINKLTEQKFCQLCSKRLRMKTDRIGKQIRLDNDSFLGQRRLELNRQVKRGERQWCCLDLGYTWDGVAKNHYEDCEFYDFC